MSATVKINTGDLSQGERLKLYRRREGLTQDDMAEQLDMTLYAYRRVEDEVVVFNDFRPPLGALAQREQCYVLRLRRGWSLADAAENMGISRWWLRRMERGDAPVNRLWNFWTGK